MLARFNESQKDELWKHYMADTFYAVHKLNVRYNDLLKPQDNRDAEEIILDTIKNAGLRIG